MREPKNQPENCRNLPKPQPHSDKRNTSNSPSSASNQFWSSRDFAKVHGHVNYRHFQAVIGKARTACFNSGQRVEDHFVGIDEMVGIGSVPSPP